MNMTVDIFGSRYFNHSINLIILMFLIPFIFWSVSLFFHHFDHFLAATEQHDDTDNQNKKIDFQIYFYIHD